MDGGCIFGLGQDFFDIWYIYILFSSLSAIYGLIFLDICTCKQHYWKSCVFTTDAEKREKLESEKRHANRGRILAFQRSDFSHFCGWVWVTVKRESGPFWLHSNRDMWWCQAESGLIFTLLRETGKSPKL